MHSGRVLRLLHTTQRCAAALTPLGSAPTGASLEGSVRPGRLRCIDAGRCLLVSGFCSGFCWLNSSVSAILTEKLARTAEHPDRCDILDPSSRKPLVDIAVIDSWHK